MERVLTGGSPYVLPLRSCEFFVLVWNICAFILVYEDALNYLPLRKN